MGAPGEEGSQGPGQHRGDVVLRVRLRETPGQVEERAGRVRVGPRRREVEEREPGGVALVDPPDHLPGPEQRLELLPGAGARLATDRAAEGGVGPDDAPPLDQRGRDGEVLEGGGEGIVHRRSPCRAEGGERGGHDLADRHAVRGGAGQAVLVLGVRPHRDASPPARPSPAPPRRPCPPSRAPARARPARPGGGGLPGWWSRRGSRGPPRRDAPRRRARRGGSRDAPSSS